jgi:hypothetical protein
MVPRWGDIAATLCRLRRDDSVHGDTNRRATLSASIMPPAADPRNHRHIVQRAFEYWCNVDKDLGDRVEKGVRGGSLWTVDLMGVDHACCNGRLFAVAPA